MKCWEDMAGKRNLECGCKRCTNTREFDEWARHHPEEVAEWGKRHPEEYIKMQTDRRLWKNNTGRNTERNWWER